MSIKHFEEVDKNIQPHLSEITLDIESAINCIETKLNGGLGKVTTIMLPIDGLAVKILLDEYKKYKKV